MDRQNLIIRSLGALVALFGSTHLALNTLVTAGSFLIAHDKMVEAMRYLADIFGPIAIREDMNTPMLLIKITVSALFLASGIGIMRRKEWARRLLFVLLGLRLAAGIVICAVFARLYTHMVIIAIEWMLLTYYFTRPRVKSFFA